MWFTPTVSPEQQRAVADDHDGVQYLYSNAWIESIETETHWRQYWNQAELVRSLVQPGSRIVELGVGSGFLAAYLRRHSYSVLTVDIDAAKQPDVVANLADYDCGPGCDVLVAFEVFEHAPFDDMVDFLDRCASKISKQLILSIPFSRRRSLLELTIRLPRIGLRSLRIPLPMRIPPADNHHWELDDGDVSSGDLETAVWETTAMVPVLRRDALGLRYLVFERQACDV